MKFSLNVFVAITCCVIGFPFPTLVSGDSTDNDKEVITFSILGTLGVEIVIAVIAYFVWKKCKAKKQKSAKANRDLHGRDNGAFSPNTSAAEQGLRIYPNQKEEFPKSKKINSPSHPTSPNDKSWNSFPNVQFAGSSIARHGSYASLDNNINSQEPEIADVNLRSQDFIGLGFNISGSMRDGIYISEVHNRGPAIESGVLKVGDRILNVTISFENMVFEDALTILSYASPYPVNICVQKHRAHPSSQKGVNGFEMQLNHPLYRSQSLDALNAMRRETLPKRSYSELKTDDKIYGSLVKSIGVGSSKSRFYTTNDVYSEKSLELPVSTQISEVIIHKPPTAEPQGKSPALESPSFEKKQNGLKDCSVKLREPYKLHPSDGSIDILESTPKLGSAGKFPLFDSDDSISKLDEKMDIHFSNCDKEFEDLKQKADKDHFNLNLEYNGEAISGSNSPNSEKEFEHLENKIKFSDNFADIFDRLTDDNKFSGLDMSFDDFVIKEKEPNKDGVASITDDNSDSSNKIFLTAETSTDLMTGNNMAAVKTDETALSNSINPASSGVPAMKMETLSDWTCPKVYEPPSSTDLLLENNELLTRPKRFRIEDSMRDDCLHKLRPKSSTEECLNYSSSSGIGEQTPKEAMFDESDSVTERVMGNVKDANENEQLSFKANAQVPVPKGQLFLSGSRPNVEETLYSVNNLVDETMPDILKESSPFKSTVVKSRTDLDSFDSPLPITTTDSVDVTLLEADLSLKETSSNLMKPRLTTGDVGLSFFKDKTESRDVETTILNPKTDTASIDSVILLPKANADYIDPFLKVDTTESPSLKYELVTEETSISLWKQELDTDSTDTDSSEYEVKTNDTDTTFFKSDDLNPFASKADDLNISASKAGDLNLSLSKADELNLSALKADNLKMSPLNVYDLSVSPSKANDLGLSSLKTDDLSVSHLKADDLSVSLSNTDDLRCSSPNTVDLGVTSSKADGLSFSSPEAVDVSVSPSKPNHFIDLSAPLLNAGDLTVPILKEDGSSVSSLMTADPSVPSLDSKDVYVSPVKTDYFYVPPLKVRDFHVSFSEVDDFNVTPLKAADLSISPLKADDVNVSPDVSISSLNSVDLSDPSFKADDLGVYPLEATDLSLSPSTASELSLSPSKKIDLSLSPPKASDLSLSPSTASELSLSPKAIDFSLSPSNASDFSLSPLKASVSTLNTDDVGGSSIKARDLDISNSKKYDFSVSPLIKNDVSPPRSKADDLSSSSLKVDGLIVSPVKADDLSFSRDFDIEHANYSIFQSNSKENNTLPTVLNSEINTDLPFLEPAVKTEITPDEGLEVVNSDSIFRDEKKRLFTEPIKLHVASKTENCPVGEKSVLASSTLQMPEEGTAQMREESSPFEIIEQMIERKKSGRLTPYKYQFKGFDIKDISLDGDDSINQSFTNIKQNLFDETRPESDQVDEEMVYPVHLSQKVITFDKPILNQDVLLPKRSLNFAVDDGATSGKGADVSQTDSNVPGKSSSEESSLDSESEEQKSDETADPSERKPLYKMPAVKRNRSEILTSSSSLDSDEDGAAASKVNLAEGLPSQPSKAEPNPDGSAPLSTSESISIHEYKMRALSLEIDRLQRDLTEREAPPTAALKLPKEGDVEEENQDKKDEAFFEMTEDEFSTDTQSLSPKSVVTRAISCDGGFVTSDDSDPSKPRTNSLKREVKDPVNEENYLDWSDNSLVRAESFSRLPDSNLAWTGSSHTKEDKIKSDSDSNSDSGRLAISEPSVTYKPEDNLTNLSLSCSSSSISSNETKTNGERGNDSETSPEPVDLKFTRPFSDESNHKADTLLLSGDRDDNNKRLVYEGHGALTLTFSAQSDTEA